MTNLPAAWVEKMKAEKAVCKCPVCEHDEHRGERCEARTGFTRTKTSLTFIQCKCIDDRKRPTRKAKR